ncbi:hypothetical protein PAPYR_10918 [Paratrimastix pyriformis]|uniref:Uncharacterized protein n=1 Tax=Paratrimastix pyriformis TaxID=342808 RepID=A0ABQ8U4U9_9EUKA|nr:hypothetical protein PAPYR_10918 [Paratrimastix pyriformis]
MQPLDDEPLMEIASEFNALKESLMQQKLQALQAVQQSLETETHPKLVSKIAHLQELHDAKIRSSKLNYKYQHSNIEALYESEVKVAQHKFDNQVSELRQKLLQRIHEKRQEIEAAHASRDPDASRVLEESPSVETIALTASPILAGRQNSKTLAKRRKEGSAGCISPTFGAGGAASGAQAQIPAQARRRLGTGNAPQLKNCLSEVEINEDFAVMHKNTELTTRFAGGEVRVDRDRLYYHNHYFEQGDAVVFEPNSATALKLHGIIVEITPSEVYFECPDSSRERISISNLRSGRSSMHFEPSNRS